MSCTIKKIFLSSVLFDVQFSIHSRRVLMSLIGLIIDVQGGTVFAISIVLSLYRNLLKKNNHGIRTKIQNRPYSNRQEPDIMR